MLHSILGVYLVQLATLLETIRPSLVGALVATSQTTLLQAINDPDLDVIELQEHITSSTIKLQPHTRTVIVVRMSLFVTGANMSEAM